MQLDWFTVLAQIINFLILVFLLKYFLYDRIIDVADKREEKISSRFEEAEEKSRQAQQKAESYEAKRQELEEKQEDLIAKAREEAEARRKELLRQARREVEETKDQWQQMLQQEQESFLQELRRRTSQQFYALARRGLADLADATLEQRMIDVFIERLDNLADDEREAIVEAIQNDRDHRLVLSSAFEIPDETRQDLLQVLRKQFDDSLDAQFKTSSDLICGIELKANGHKIAWSLQNYLAALEENLARTLEEEQKKKGRAEEAKANET